MIDLTMKIIPKFIHKTPSRTVFMVLLVENSKMSGSYWCRAARTLKTLIEIYCSHKEDHLQRPGSIVGGLGRVSFRRTMGQHMGLAFIHESSHFTPKLIKLCYNVPLACPRQILRSYRVIDNEHIQPCT